MKKLISIVLAFAMACMLIPAVAEVAADTITGEWYALDMIQGDMTIHIADMGMSYVMILNEDGTMVMTMSADGMEQSQEGTWEIIDGKIIVTAVEEDFTSTLEVVPQEDGTLLANDEGMSMVFSREAAETVTIEIADVKAAESADEFYGDWTLVYLEMDGRLMNIAAMGDEGSGMTLSETGLEFFGEGTFGAMLSVINVIEKEAPVFADGVLSVKATADSLNPDLTATAELLEDGMLKLTLMNDTPMILYFTPAEAE